MATQRANDLFTKPVHAGGGFGNQSMFTGSVTLTSAPAAEIIRPVFIPAGTEVGAIDIIADDVDSNATPTLVMKAGYTYADGSAAPSGADTAFGSGLTIGQAAALTSLRFHPFRLEKDAFLDLVVTTAAATFAAGKISAVVSGVAHGAK